MSYDAILVNIAVVVTFVCGFAKNRSVRLGNLRQHYWFMIIAGTSNMVLNGIIAYENPEYSGMYLWNILIAHTIYSAIMGLRRLRSE
jgi:hypothetical protein